MKIVNVGSFALTVALISLPTASALSLEGVRAGFGAGVVADNGAGFGPRRDFEQWLTQQSARATLGLLGSFSSTGTTSGSVIASPSQINPDYFYHWVRDGALCMDLIVREFPRATSAAQQRVWEYVEFSRLNQKTPNRSGGLGEPKFRVDGSAFDGDWNRPQNDGPALRALTLIRFAQGLLDQGAVDGDESAAKEKVLGALYHPRLPAQTLIKADLEFVSHHWKEASFDLWEETWGQHFYTRMVQRRALLDGARLAERLDDPSAARWYRKNAAELETALRAHWDPDRRFLRATLDQTNMPHKTSNLDVAVILAVLHASNSTGVASGGDIYSPTSDEVLSTAIQLRDSFRAAYPINQNRYVGTAIGRYPEDLYDGDGMSGGNPWFLSIAAYAELYYRAAHAWREQGHVTVSATNLAFLSELTGQSLQPGTQLVAGDPEYQDILRAMGREGDRYLEAIRLHADNQGSMSEQINRFTGFMQGARDLTWSYASFLTAVRARGN